MECGYDLVPFLDKRTFQSNKQKEQRVFKKDFCILVSYRQQWNMKLNRKEYAC